MSIRISSIYYFDYTKKIGFYDSIRDFTSLEMEYIAMAISTEKIRVNATPTQFSIDAEGTNQIREYAISYMGQLIEISKELAINSPQYILIHYADDTEKYFKYDENFCKIFSMATDHKVVENIQTVQEENPYILQKSNEEDSAYCVQKAPTYTQSAIYEKPSTNMVTSHAKKTGFTPLGKILVGIVIIIMIFTFIFSEESEDSSADSSKYNESSLVPVTEPVSGTILSGSEVYDGSEIVVTASGGESCVVKMKTSSGVTRLSFYVRAGDTVTVGVPAEYLYVYFASGDTWYGTSNLFGDYTSYSMDDELCDFTQYAWEYTLYPVNNGNFSQTPIDASDF